LIGFSFSHSTDAINFKLVLRKCFPSELQQDIMNRNLFNSRRKMKGDTYIDDEIRHAKFSAPVNFEHCDHLGWDSINHCLDFNNISKELKQLLKEAGVKKKELRSKENALLVLGLLLSPLDAPESGGPGKKQTKSKDQGGPRNQGKESQIGVSKINTSQNLPGMGRSMGPLMGQSNVTQNHSIKIGAPPPPVSNASSNVIDEKGPKASADKPKMGTTIGKQFTVQEGLNIKTNLHSALDKRRAALMKGAANKRGEGEEEEQESNDSSWSD
jgi:P21-Rho-binding domain